MKSVLFPGYGSQFVGMGKELYDRERVVQEYFEEAATCLNLNFVKLCFASSEVELARSVHAYPALFLMGASSAGLLKEKNVPYELVAGVDLVSWYSALFAAGSITLPDGLYMLNKIAGAYEEYLAQGSYAGIKISGLTERKVDALCSKVDSEVGTVSLAAVYPDSVVVTGTLSGIEALQEQLDEQDIVYTETDITGGLQSALAEAFSAPLNDYFEKIDIKEPLVPIVSPLNGKIIKKVDQLRDMAKIVLTKPLAVGKVYEQLGGAEKVYLAIPGNKFKAQLPADMPVTTMETAAEFDAIIAELPKETEDVREQSN